MHRFFIVAFGLLLLTDVVLGAAKPHVISFGKWTTIKWCVGPNEGKCLDLKVRALYMWMAAPGNQLWAHPMKSPSGCLWSAAPSA